MTVVIARIPSENWDSDKTGTERKWHIITKRSRHEYSKKTNRPRCGQDGWILTESNTVNKKEISSEELQKYVNMGIICGNCLTHYSEPDATETPKKSK